MNEQLEMTPKKLQMSHANHYRLCKWIEGNAERVKELTLDEAVMASSEALRIAVSRNAVYDAAKICAVPLRRKQRASTTRRHKPGRDAQEGFTRSPSKTSRIIASALLHLYDELGLQGPTSTLYRTRLVEIVQHSKLRADP